MAARLSLTPYMNLALSKGGEGGPTVTEQEMKMVVGAATLDGKIGKADKYVISCFVGSISGVNMDKGAAEYFNALVADGTLNGLIERGKKSPQDLYQTAVNADAAESQESA